MSCDTYREAVSALLDGEDAGLEDDRVRAHLGTCRSCAAWADELSTLHRMVRVREAEPVPDLTAAILDAAPTARP